MSMNLVEISKSTSSWLRWENQLEGIEKGLPSYLKHVSGPIGPEAAARLARHQAGRGVGEQVRRVQSLEGKKSPLARRKKIVAERSVTARINEAGRSGSLAGEGTSSYKASGVGRGPELRTYESQNPLGTHIKPEFAAGAAGVGALGAIGGGAALVGRHLSHSRAAAQAAAKRRKVLIGAGAGGAGLLGLGALGRRD